MKYIKSLICILLVAVMFSGCSFKIASSVYDLISPVAPFGDNADIQSAMDTYVKNGYNLKTPTGGKYKSSYLYLNTAKASIITSIPLSDAIRPA